MSLPPPPPPKTNPDSLSSSNTLTLPSTYTHNAEDEPISPLTQTFTTTTKAPSHSLSYKKPSLTTSTNWNDLPLSWTHHSCTRPQAPRSSSSTALDINALYATANPRVTPRRRLSSMINTKAQTTVSAPTTPMTATIPTSPPPYQDDGEWRDVKGNVERGERGSVSTSSGYAYGDEERTRRRARRQRTIKGVAVLCLLITMGVLGVLVKGGPLTSTLSSFGWVSENLHANAEGGDMSGTFWEFNISGMPSGEELMERCKAMSWRPKMPEFLTKYFSDGEEEGEGEHEIQTITRTIRLTNGDGEFQRPLTVSRIWRGKGPVRINRVAEEKKHDGETEFGDDGDEWEREFQGVQERSENADQLNEAEEEAHRARVSEMGFKHDAPVDAPVPPPEDNEHGGHQEVLEGN